MATIWDKAFSSQIRGCFLQEVIRNKSVLKGASRKFAKIIEVICSLQSSPLEVTTVTTDKPTSQW